MHLTMMYDPCAPLKPQVKRDRLSPDGVRRFDALIGSLTAPSPLERLALEAASRDPFITHTSSDSAGGCA